MSGPPAVKAAAKPSPGDGDEERSPTAKEKTALGGLLDLTANAITIRQLLTHEPPGARSDSTIAQLEAFISGFEFFRDIPPAAVRFLAQRIRSEKFSPSHPLFAEQDAATCMFVVTAGAVGASGSLSFFFASLETTCTVLFLHI